MEAWNGVFEEHKASIGKNFTYPKTEFYKALNVPYEFWSYENNMIKLTLTYTKDTVVCQQYNLDDEWIKNAGIILTVNNFTDYLI